MSCCAIATCPNNSTKTDKSVILYHRFPQDPEICKQWVLKCKREDKINCKNARVCSEHFRPEDYEDDIKNRLLNLPTKKILKKCAIPTLKLPQSPILNQKLSTTTASNIEERERRAQTRTIRVNALDRIANISPKKRPRLDDSENNINPHNSVTESITSNIIAPCTNRDTYEHLLDENEQLKKRIDSLETELSQVKNKSNNLYNALRKKQKCKLKSHLKNAKLTNTLKSQISFYKKKYQDSRKLIGFVSKFISPTQIKSLEAKGKITRWTNEEISRAVLIRAMSRKSYDFWREKIEFPLPSPSTLHKWCSKFTLYPGLLTNVLTIVSNTTESLTEMDRLCVLSFDEIHINSKVVYDAGLDQILGPHSKAQVALLRGLTNKWKQPIFFDFDTNMDKDLLFKIIKGAHQAGLNVCAIVSDLGGCGTLWKELGISIKCSSFVNPADENSTVWVFADMPHYLKLLRNHFLDEGFVLHGGTEVTVNILHDVLSKDSGEIKLCHKLDNSLLTLKGNERQRVAPARAVFSRTTAKAIEVLTGNKKVSEFFELTDKFVDIMNSHSPFPTGSEPMRAAFGRDEYFEEQTKVLNEFKEAVLNFRVKGKKSLMPFQKGIIISINSLFGLYEHLKPKGVKYIMTTRLTQDVLESLFSQIRGAGIFADHPTPTEFISRMKKIMLANKMPKPSPKTNVELEKSEELNVYLTAELINSAFTPKEVEEVINEAEPEIHEDLDYLSDDPEVPKDLRTRDKSLCWAEEEALSYVAGYVAFRVRKIDPSLGNMSRSIPENELSNEKWISKLSYGKLTVPSETWKATVQRFEIIFKELHGENSLCKQKGVIKELKKRLSKEFPNVNASAIHVYARIRTFIRIKHVNKEHSSKRSETKKAKKWIGSQKKGTS